MFIKNYKTSRIHRLSVDNQFDLSIPLLWDFFAWLAHSAVYTHLCALRVAVQSHVRLFGRTQFSDFENSPSNVNFQFKTMNIRFFTLYRFIKKDLFNGHALLPQGNPHSFSLNCPVRCLSSKGLLHNSIGGVLTYSIESSKCRIKKH